MGRVGAMTLQEIKDTIKLNELQAPDGAVAMNSQKITGMAAAVAQGDAIAADANVRAPDSAKLGGSTKATVQTHTPAAHEGTHAAGGSDDIDSALALAAIPTPLTGKDADTVDGYEGAELGEGLTLALFRTNPGTGTVTTPDNINDDDTATIIWAVLGQYVDVDWVVTRKVTMFRQYGGTMNEDGTWKIQHWNGAAWVDNTLDIPTKDLGWTDWINLTTPVITSKIRVVATLIDSYGQNRIKELEMQG